MAGRSETLRELQSAFQPNCSLSDALLHKAQQYGLLVPLSSYLSSHEHCLNEHEQAAEIWLQQTLDRMERSAVANAGNNTKRETAKEVCALEGLFKVASSLLKRAQDNQERGGGMEADVAHRRHLRARAELFLQRLIIEDSVPDELIGMDGTTVLESRKESLKFLNAPLLFDILTQPLQSAAKPSSPIRSVKQLLQTLLSASRASTVDAEHFNQAARIALLYLACLCFWDSSDTVLSQSELLAGFQRRINTVLKANPLVAHSKHAFSQEADVALALFCTDAAQDASNRHGRARYIGTASSLLCQAHAGTAVPPHLRSSLLRALHAHAARPDALLSTRQACCRACESMGVLEGTVLAEAVSYLHALVRTAQGGEQGGQGGMWESCALDKALALVNSRLDVTATVTVPAVARRNGVGAGQGRQLGGKRVGGGGAEAAIKAAVTKGVTAALESMPEVLRGWGGAVTARVSSDASGGLWRVAVRVQSGSAQQAKQVHTVCSQPAAVARHVTEQLAVSGVALRDGESVATLGVAESSRDALTLLHVLFCALLAAAPASRPLPEAGGGMSSLLLRPLSPFVAGALMDFLAAPQEAVGLLDRELRANQGDSEGLRGLREAALIKAKDGGGRQLSVLYALLHREYGNAVRLLGSSRQEAGSLAEQALAVLAGAEGGRAALPRVQGDPTLLTGSEGGTAGPSSEAMEGATTFEREAVWGSLAQTGAGGGGGGGPFGKPPSPAVAVTPAHSKAATPSTWGTLGDRSTDVSMMEGAEASREWSVRAASPALTPAQPFASNSHAAMGKPSPFVPRWLSRQSGGGTPMRPTPGSSSKRPPSSTPSKGLPPRPSPGVSTPSFVRDQVYHADEEVSMMHRSAAAFTSSPFTQGVATPSPGVGSPAWARNTDSLASAGASFASQQSLPGSGQKRYPAGTLFPSSSPRGVVRPRTRMGGR